MDRKIKSITIFFLLILSSILVVTPSIEASETYTEIEITPNFYSSDYVENETINLSILVTPETGQNIDTVATDLITFPAGILECTNLAWGDLFSATTFRILGTIDNNAGTITNMVWGSSVPTQNPGYFVNMTFKVINPGVGSIIIDTDEAGVAYAASPLPFVITYNFTFDLYTFQISNEYPVNESIDESPFLQLAISLLGAYDMDITWTSNATGLWKLLGQDDDLSSGRYYMSCYGVVESPYDQELDYLFSDYSSNIYHNNTCPAKDLGTIKSITLYTPSFTGTIRPIFNGFVQGETYSVSGSTYTDITNDSYAPTDWWWDDIKNLDVYTSSATTIYVAVIYDLGFGEGVRVDWRVNVTDGLTWINESYWYITGIDTPTIRNPLPYDSELWNYINPTLAVNISDPNGDTMNVSFYWYNGDDWEQLGTNQSGTNGTYSQPTTLNNYSQTYFWRVFADDRNGHIANRVFRFTLRDIQDAPYNFTAETGPCSTQINLSWDKPLHTDKVRIQRRIDTYPTSVDDGLNIYNGTAEFVNDTLISPGTIYYYTAWSWNETDKTWSEENSTVFDVSPPLLPTNFNATVLDYQSIGITWTKGIGAYTTLIRKKLGSYPTNQTDGIFVYEGEESEYNDTGLLSNVTYFYRAWAHYDSGLFTRMYGIDENASGYRSLEINNYQSYSQPFTLTKNRMIYCNEISVHIGHYAGGYPGNSGKYIAQVYLDGDDVGGEGVNSIKIGTFYGIGSTKWKTCSVPNVLLLPGKTYYVRVRGSHTCSPQCCYNPVVRWTKNATGQFFRLYGSLGYYSCGYDEDNETTLVGPPQIETNSTSNIDDYTARINGHLISDGGEATTCGFIWENESGSQNTTIGAYTNDQSFYLDIAGLNMATTYNCTAWALNANGFVLGNQISFNTKPYPPSNLTFSNVTYDSFDLLWDLGLGSDATMIRYKEGSYPTDVNDGEGFLIDTDFATIPYLDSNTTYYVRIWSYNGTEEIYSNIYEQNYTTTAIGAPVIDTLDATNIDDMTAILHAELTEDSGDACSVGFRWGTTHGVYPNNVTTGTYNEGQIINQSIGSLSKGTTYYYQAWAKNAGYFISGSELSFATKPVEPDTLIAIHYGAQQINLTWNKGQGADKTRIQAKIGSYPTNETDGTNIYEGTESYFNHTSIIENTAYYYRIWSLNDTNGLYSNLYDEAYDTTDWLPNITFMSPCDEININRIPEYSASGEDDNPITYRFYHIIGENERRLPDTAWSSSVKWSNLDAALDYGGSSAIYYPYRAWEETYCQPIYLNFSKPIEVSGVNLSFQWTGPGVTNTRIKYHDFYNDTWITITKSGATYHFSFSSIYIDNISFQVSKAYSPNSEHIYLDYINLYHDRTLLTETSASSNEVKNSSDNEAIYENYTYWWEFEVFNGIDSVFGNCSYTTETILFSDQNPYDGEEVDNTKTHTCNIRVNHTGGDLMDIYFFYYNYTTLNYTFGGENLGVGNGSLYWDYPNSDEFDTTYTWKVCAWDSYDWHNESYIFIVRETYTPVQPNFNLENVNTTVVNVTDISWDSKTDSIMIRWKLGSYPSSISDGNLLFNGTYTEYQHLGLDPNTYYYYSMWAWNETDMLWSTARNKNIQTLGPQPPSYNLSKINSTIINITDILRNDIYSDTILIRAKIGSYPTDIDDGILVMNSTASSFLHIGLIPENHYYYRAWTYDDETDWWSDSTDKNQKTNGQPTLSDISPYNGEQLDGVNPLMNVTVGEYNPFDIVNVSFYSNYSGSWTLIYSDEGIPDRYEYQSTEFYLQEWNYWWSINVTDGEYWINQTLAFRTGSMAIPEVYAETYNVSQINLSWTIAPLTTHTWIQRKINDYPTSRTDGTNIYFGTGEYYEDIDLDPGELYKYTIWSYNQTLDIYSSITYQTKNLTKPYGPTNLSVEKFDYQTVNVSWVKGIGSEDTLIVLKEDNYPVDRFDGTIVYLGNLSQCQVTDLKPDDYLNYFSPASGTNDYGTQGDPFSNSYDENTGTKWDLLWDTTGTFRYTLGVEPQRVKGFALLIQDFYQEPGMDWEAAITDFEIYNGSWYPDWSGLIYNTNSSPWWFYYESDNYYSGTTDVRFSAYTEWITPNLYEVLIGKLGYIHCFKAWGVVTKEDITQYSDETTEAANRTEDTPPNQVPIISNMNPTNESINVEPDPAFYVTIADPEGTLMNISWQYLNGSEWTEFGTTLYVANGTYSKSPIGLFDEFNATYYWRVIVNDSADVGESAIQNRTAISPTFWFKIRNLFIPDAPTTFDAETAGIHEINLTSTFSSEMIYIERNTTCCWALGEGTFVYVGTNTFYQDSGLIDNTNYFYQAWGYNSTDDTYSLVYLDDNATTLESPNDPPDVPILPVPTSGSDYEDVYNIYLKCNVTDPDGDNMDVSFYWGNDTLIGTDTTVANDTQASIYLPNFIEPDWVEHDITYYWYAVASDAEYNTSSSTWNFKTCKAWDLNVDRIVNYLDVSLMVAHYLDSVIPPGSQPWDVNNDGSANYLDLSAVVGHYLESY